MTESATVTEWVVLPEVALMVTWVVTGAGVAGVAGVAVVGEVVIAACDVIELEHPTADREITPKASRSTMPRSAADLRRTPMKANRPSGARKAMVMREWVRSWLTT